MSVSSTVVPILATPLGRASLSDAPRLNAELAPWLRAMRDGDSAPRSSPLLYRTADDLFDRPEPFVKKLAVDMMQGVYSVISSISELPEDDLKSLRPEGRGWFTVIDQYGAMPSVNHPLTAWCAVYCIMSPPPSVARQDSGALRFYQSGFGTMLQDATNSPLRMPFHTGHYSWHPTAGEMVIFPASVCHEVALLHTAGSLMLATLRLRFVAPGQTGLARW
jgi:hypothetical protein